MLLGIKTNKLWKALIFFTGITVLVAAGCISTDRSRKQTPKVQLTPEPVVEFAADRLQQIGQKIYLNETGGNVKHLIFWSDNEGFASLGVGHFIWYPEGKVQRFKQTFPDMIRFLKSKQVAVPDWLMKQIEIGSLWNNREELEQSRDNPKFLALQQLLIDHSGFQVEFLFQRLERALPRILDATNPSVHELITNRFNRIKHSEGGLYPLVDYVNFKGEGTVPEEGYQGEGWGLLQVLESMKDTPPGLEALKAFAEAADIVLTRRVQNSPPSRNEQRWLPGWRVRLLTYYQ